MRDHIHLTIPPPILAPTFARSLSPGCPTESAINNRSATQPPWSIVDEHPRTAISREPSFGLEMLPVGTTTWRIPPGTYIAFALDTNSIASQFASGSEGYEAVRQFPVRRYIGLVAATPLYHEGGRMIEELVVNYVAGAPPPIGDFDAAGTRRQYMYVDPSSVDGGTPLQTTKLFPWQDKVQWTTFGTRLTIETLHESTLHFELKDDELTRFENQVHVDYEEIAHGQANSQGVDKLLDGLMVPQYALPAVIWRDIRGAGFCDDPTAFVKEIAALESIVQRYC